MNGTGHPRAATAIAVAAWSLAVLAVVVMVMGRPVLDQDLWFFVVDIAVACVYGTVAGVTLSRRSHPVPWLLGLAALGGGLAGLGYAYEVWSAHPGGLPPNEVLGHLQNTAWVPGTMSLFLVVPWLVRDHPLGRARIGLAVGVFVTVAFTLGEVLLLPVAVLFLLLCSAILVGLVAAAAVALRHRNGPVEERNGLGWLAVGTAILAVSFIPLISPWPWLPYWLTPILHLLSQTVFPAAVLVAVLRNRMWGLRLVVSRAVLAGLMATILLGSYLVISVLLERLLPGDGAAQLIAAGAVVVAVQPARILVGKRVNRLVYGESADPGRVVRRLGSQLVGSATVAELLGGVTEDIGRSMRLESVTVAADGLEPVTWGIASEPPTEVDLQHRGKRVGVLAVSPRPGESLSGRDLSTLGELSSVVAAAVAVARTAADLSELQSRLSEVRLEERRVIRREIHDGLGPSLAGISLGLQGVRNLLATDPVAGSELLGHLQEEVESAMTGVRNLSHHLLPPVLDELGLVAALTELAGRYDGTGLTVSVEADPLHDLDPQLAAAAYGIVSEATTNVARHAAASHCRVIARRRDGQLEVTVIDNGVGLPADVVPGVGSRSMRERATEQGGALELRRRPEGGTEVRALLPVGVGTRA
jgi:signal transduction histidine kinase